MVVGSINILFSVVWLSGGVILLRRAMADKPRPTGPVSSLTQPEARTEKQLRWARWFSAVMYLVLGVLYLLKDILSHRY